MKSEIINIFATIGATGTFFFLIFCIGCGMAKIADWAEAVKRDKKRQKREGE